MFAKKFVFIFLIFSGFGYASAQTITGKIQSKTTKQPIPFATITTTHTKHGTYADSLGVFKLTGNYQPHDTLQFRILGYETRRISVEDARKMKIFELNESATDLSEVVVNKRNEKQFLIGCKARNNQSKHSLIGTEFAIFVFNDEYKEGFLKEISIYLSSDKVIDANFRLMIYPNLEESKEILKEDIRVGNGFKREGWFTFDLSKHHLQVLNQGFYVSLTMLADKDGIPPLSIGLTEGFEGGVIHARKRDDSWGWLDWSRFKYVTPSKNTYYAMMKAVVEFYD